MAGDGVPGVSFYDLSKGGQVGELIGRKDWSRTTLGPRDSWPRSLNNHLSMIFELPTAAIIFWGEDQLQLYNDGYSVIMGPRHPQYLGSPFRECWPEAYATIHPWMKRVLENGETVEVNRTLVPLTRFGFTEEAYFTFSFSPLRDDHGKIAGVLQLVTEVTEAVLGERRAGALRELSNQTAHAKTTQDAIRLATDVLCKVAHDLPFCLIYLIDPADRRRLTLFGSTGLPEDHGPFPKSVDLGPDEAGPIPELARAVRERGVLPIEKLAMRGGRVTPGPWPEPPALALASPIAAADQQTVVAVLVTGISPRLALDGPYRGFVQLVSSQLATLLAAARAYEDERKRADALAEIDRAKTEFFSNVSHEFRTPLTLMLGPLEDELAERQAPLPRERLDRLQAVHRNSLRLLKLVNSLLEFSRIEAGRTQATYQPTDLGKYTSELASSFHSAMAKAGLDFTVDCPALPQPVYVDREMWEKIVLNLVSNAFKHTFAGGVAVRLREIAGYAELSVSDTGVGIAAADQERLFERFHRVRGARSRTHEGSGIGLALVRELAALHGGAVSLKSEHGQGSTFSVRVKTGLTHLPPERIGEGAERTSAGADAYVKEALRWLPEPGTNPPLIPAPGGVASPSSPQVTPSDGARPRPKILLADDNADMRDYVRRLLEDRYDVCAVADGEAALRAAREEPRPNLVLSDVMMPILDGIGLLRELRKNPATETLPVILLSARAGEESEVEGLDAGADDYIVKPFSARELLARVRTHLEIARTRQEWAHELERANKELEAFSYSVSHDLRAPLRVIDGYSKMLLEDYEERLDPEGRRLLGTVASGARKMGELIDDLLEFSRLGRKALKKSSFDPAALAREVLPELLAQAAGRKVESSVEELPMAWGDPALFRQVFVNLLSNALKYTRPRDPARIVVGGTPGPEGHTYWVKDNGVGFLPELSHRLFRVFQRLHSEREFEGTGVGLALVQRIVERHGGRVWAEGRPDHGATFFFSLPPRDGESREGP